MKSTKLSKHHDPTGPLFIALITLFFILYFVVYLTPSRKSWYGEMRNQVIIIFNELTNKDIQ